MKTSCNKYLTVLVILLIVSNVFTLSLLLKKKGRSANDIHGTCSPQECYLTRSLQLEGKKQDSLVAITSIYRQEAAPLADELRRQQSAMLLKMAEGDAGSSGIDSIQQNILSLQARLLKLSVKQYQDIRAILDKNERARLSKAYFLVFGCDTAQCRLNHQPVDHDK